MKAYASFQERLIIQLSKIGWTLEYHDWALKVCSDDGQKAFIFYTLKEVDAFIKGMLSR